MTNRRPLTAAEFFRKYQRRHSGAMPRHARLRLMLESALESGEWREGQSIPTEHELARAGVCSVGTVQRAIRDLVGSGDLRRVPGRGTFVTRNSYRLGEPFTNTRFLAEDGAGILPVRATFLGRDRLRAAGPWIDVLGASPDTILRIERLFDVNSEFRVLSRFYVDTERFAELESLPAARLKTANLKQLIARTYRLPAITLRQALRFKAFDAEVAARIRCPRGTTGLLQTVTAWISDDDAVYYHDLHIPPNSRALELPRLVLRRGS